MAILFEPRPTEAEAYSFALVDDVAVVDSFPGLLRLTEQRPDETLVVIGAEVELQPALDFAESHRVTRPALGIVLLRRRIDASVLGYALRAGVREVVNSDDLRALGDACRRSREISENILRVSRGEGQAAGSRHGRVVTVFSAKGGCGKTTIATNLACALAADKQRKVCLVDFDLAFGDVAIALQLVPEQTITDATVMDHIDEVGVRSLVTPHHSGVDTVLAPLEPGRAETVSPAVISELLQVLKRMYDFIVVDTPPAFNEHVLATFDLTDMFCLLATLDIPALKNLKLTLEMMEILGYPKESWHLVLNRSDARVGLSTSDVERILKTSIALAVPSSREVPASINRGTPIVLEQPGHAVSHAIRKLAGQVRASAGAELTVERHKGRGRRLPSLRRGSVPA